MSEATGKTDLKSRLKLAANPTKRSVQGRSLLSGSDVTWSKIDFTFFLSCGILVLRPETKSTSPVLQGRFLTTGAPGKFPSFF